MATYKGICKLTKKEETIWFDMIPTLTQSNPNGVAIGLMIKCSANNKVCEECNIHKDLLQTTT